MRPLILGGHASEVNEVGVILSTLRSLMGAARYFIKQDSEKGIFFFSFGCGTRCKGAQ